MLYEKDGSKLLSEFHAFCDHQATILKYILLVHKMFFEQDEMV